MPNPRFTPFLFEVALNMHEFRSHAKTRTWLLSARDGEVSSPCPIALLREPQKFKLSAQRRLRREGREANPLGLVL